MVETPSTVAIVTGAASGMGLATARLMAETGMAVLLCDLHADRLEQAAAHLPGKKETLAADISDPAFGAQLGAALGDRKIGALVHCAGLSPTMGSPERILDVNLRATMRLADFALPRMTQGAAAVLFSSCSAHQAGEALDPRISPVTTPEQVDTLLDIAPNSGIAYMISKRAVLLLAQREAGRFGARGARLLTISPGIIDTPMGRAERAEHASMQKMIDQSALQRPALAEEVAAVAAFLCSPAASFLTGTDILVDGGAIAGGKWEARVEARA